MAKRRARHLYSEASSSGSSRQDTSFRRSGSSRDCYITLPLRAYSSITRTLMTFAYLSLRDALGVLAPANNVSMHLQEALGWLCRAQDAAGGGGVARSYSLWFKRVHHCRGWLAAFPETTGYIIPTFFDCAALTGD